MSAKSKGSSPKAKGRKPLPQTRKVLDWGQCTDFIEAKYKLNTRDYTLSHSQFGEWCAANKLVVQENSQPQWAQFQADIRAGKIVERPYQDFWHWLTDVADIHRGGTVELYPEMGRGAEPWQKEILGLYLKEFGKGPYLTDW